MRRRNRIDTVQPLLVARMKALGADWLPWPGGTIDGIAKRAGHIYVVDFKSKIGSPLTRTQAKLVERGWPIWFPRSEADVDRMFGVKA